MEISTLQGEHIVTIAINLGGMWHRLVLELVVPLEVIKGLYPLLSWMLHQWAVVWGEVVVDLDHHLYGGAEAVLENLTKVHLQGRQKGSQTSVLEGTFETVQSSVTMMNLQIGVSLIGHHLWIGVCHLVLETGKEMTGFTRREVHWIQGVIDILPHHHHHHVVAGERMQGNEVGLLLEVCQKNITENLMLITEEMINEGDGGIDWMTHTRYI